MKNTSSAVMLTATLLSLSTVSVANSNFATATTDPNSPTIIEQTSVNPALTEPVNTTSQAIAEKIEIGINTTQSSVNSLPEIDFTLPPPVEDGNLYETHVELLPKDASQTIAALISNNAKFVNWQGQIIPLHSPAAIAQLYKSQQYRPLWLQNGKITSLAQSLIQETQKAKFHALKNSTYHTEITASLAANQSVNDPDILDVILTDAFVSYKNHLTNGIVNPTDQFPTWNLKARTIDYGNLYQQVKTFSNVTEAFHVDDDDYNTLQQAYEAALKKQAPATPTNTVVQIPAKSLKLGSKGPAVKILRERLGLSIGSDIYDAEVKQAIKDFQVDKGLNADGFAGHQTIAALNGKKADDHKKVNLNKLAINMERYRWSYIPTSTNHIWVNIPAFKMAVKQQNKKIFQSDVIVGKRKRPTPIFSDHLEDVVLAPYWNVPSTIFKEDKLPKLKKNPDALGNRMQVINTATGKVVSASSVNWKNGGTGYRLRQKPGARNALGYMKFLFPNRHAIYLHDTPSRNLFKRKMRALSSGCIRVQRAEDLAVFLLENQNYDRARIKKESRESTEKWVRLKKSLQYPVFLNYYTAWVDNDGQIRYSKDIYGYDKKMSKLYQAALSQL